jgi:hypothetical protein
MYKLNISPDSTGYSVLDGNTNVFTQLDGGDPRVRADQLGAAGTVAVQWTLGPADYKVLRAFYRTGAKNGSEPFQVDLVGIDDDQVRTYTARFVPGTFKLASQSGLTYIQTASLWVVPLSASSGGISGAGTAQDTTDDIRLIFPPEDLLPPPPPGQKIAWAFATAALGGNLAGSGAAYYISGASFATRTSGGLGLVNGGPITNDTISAGWSGFTMPPEIPVGATIVAMYPVVVVSPSSIIGGFTRVSGPGWSINAFIGTIIGPSLGTLISALTGTSMSAAITNSTASIDPIGAPVSLSLGIDFLAIAVYYNV